MALEDTLYQPRPLKWLTGLVSAVDTTLHELTLEYAGGTVPHVRYLRGTFWAVGDLVECLSDETRGIIAFGSPFPRTGTVSPGPNPIVAVGSLNNTLFTQISGFYVVEFGPINLPRAATKVRIDAIAHVQAQQNAAMYFNIGWENTDAVSELIYTNIGGTVFVHGTYAKSAWVTDPAKLGAGNHRLYVALGTQSGGPVQVYNVQCSWEATV